MVLYPWRIRRGHGRADARLFSRVPYRSPARLSSRGASFAGCGRRDDGLTAVVLGHEQALAQCRQWLDSHLTRCPARRLPVMVPLRCAQQRDRVAAIAGDLAAQLHQLTPLANAIQDSSAIPRDSWCWAERVSPVARQDITAGFRAIGPVHCSVASTL